MNLFKLKNNYMYMISFIIVCSQLYIASKYIVIIPMVDGWPIWNRIMQLDSHEISWFKYLFSPHGAHPHSIVYLIGWLDFHYGQAQQYLMMWLSFFSITLLTLFIVHLIIMYSKQQGWQTSKILFLIIAISFCVTNLSDTETIIQPFQVVMNMSRLVYVVLLWYLIETLLNQNIKGYIVVVFLSSIAVTFHGAGYIFAGLFILTNLLLAKNKWMILSAFIPLLILTVIFKIFANGGGEISQLGRVLSIDVLMSLFKAICAYYATPLNNISNKTILFVGFILFLFITGITIYILGKVFYIRLNFLDEKIYQKQFLKEEFFLGIMGAFILLSSIAAAVFMVIRGQLFGDFEAYEMVLITHRYSAYASLTYIVCLVVMASSKHKFNLIIFKLLSIVIIIFSLYSTKLLLKDYNLNDRLNTAAAGLAIGLSPTNSEIEIVWLAAKSDWYWKDALPLTVVYLHSKKKSLWGQLPDLFSLGSTSLLHSQLEKYSILPMESDIDKRVCKITGLASSNVIKNSLSTIVNQNYEAIGFVAMIREPEKNNQTKFQGYILCNQSMGNQVLYIMDGKLEQWKHPTTESLKRVQANNLTNGTWLNGIARNWAGFFVEDTQINKSIFRQGRIISFEDETLRTIIRQESANGYLNIFLNGPILDGKNVGYPHSMKVMN